jgi:PPOX class probable FMN-dependent enzyme
VGFESTITSADGLREVYRPPGKPSLAKQIDHLDENCRAFIAHSPFFVLASSDDQGRCDVSPKGGPPGFVTVLDEHRLGIPDLSGNNRLDSMENLVRNPGIGLLFLIPGLDETLRVNGRAEITTDAAVLDACGVRDIRPRVVIGVTVEEAFIHCAKALRRAGIWETAAWPDLGDLPSAASMLRDHCAMPELDLDAMEQRLEASYSKTTWLAGGEDPPA